jgi:hypothetical protein
VTPGERRRRRGDRGAREKPRETRMKRFCIKSVTAFGLCLFTIASTRSAGADPSVTDKSIATQLFKEGRALLDQGHVAQACRKLEESQRIDPGGGTLLNLAVCHEREGRTATAWVEFTEALGVARREERPQRVEFARGHIAALEPVLSRLVIEVVAAADIPDLEVKRDGSVVGRAAWGSGIPVDPGDHVIDAVAPGKIPWRQSVVIAAKSDTKTVTVPQLEDAVTADRASSQAAPAASPGAVARAEAEAQLSPPEKATAERSTAGTSAAPAWIAVGIGVAASGVGTYFALSALASKNDADRNCPNDMCSAEGASKNSDAIRSANYATASFGVGIVGLGVGAVLFATRSPSRAAASSAHAAPIGITAGDLSVGPGRGVVTVSGRW